MTGLSQAARSNDLQHFFSETAAILKSSENKALDVTPQSRAFTWINHDQTATETTSLENLRTRFWNLATHKINTMMEKADDSQNRLAPPFRLPFTNLKTLFVERQYSHETEAHAKLISDVPNRNENATSFNHANPEKKRDELLTGLDQARQQTAS